jgi:biotin operon repressor
MKRALIAAMLSALATGAVLATVGFGASSPTATSSKKSSSKSSSTATQSGPPQTMKQAYAEHEKRRAARQEKLADALGVSAAKLTDALEQIRKDKLAADVKANRLTQAQMDAILACEQAPLTCDRSNLPARGPGRGHHGGRKGMSTFAADLAKALGVDESKVEDALESARPERPAGGGMPGHGRGGRGGHGGPGGPGGFGGFGGP